MERCEFLVIGAGIAGASVGCELAAHASTVVLEREAQPGYHSTGRSAALYMQSYGTPAIRALTRASRPFYDRPPAGFAAGPILTRRGVLHVAAADQAGLFEAAWRDLSERGGPLRRVGRDEMLAAVPVLRPATSAAGIAEDDASDIDVHALHQGWLRALRGRGGRLRTGAEVVGAVHADGGWQVRLADGDSLHARWIVDAAGAWADEVARLAGVRGIGLEPRRRTAFTFAPPPGIDAAGWPAVVGIDESWYFKPDAGHLLGSPANADPVHPHDVVPEELDVALGIHRIEQATTLTIRRPRSVWSGLRSFVADGDMVIGGDPEQPGFFWLAAQGGYGIQSAAGAALLARSLLLGEDELPEVLRAEGVSPAALAPQRLR